jgi:uridine phosphorylase
MIPHTDLILNPDGSVYHLRLLPHQVAKTIITVGDPHRVADVSKHFDTIEHKVEYREFITHTGYLSNHHLSVISTGIGTDNIDIVLTELDALFNVDLHHRKVKEELTTLKIIRLGTSGCLQADIPVDSILISEYSIGLDGLLHHYVLENTIQELNLLNAFVGQISLPNITPYVVRGGEELIQLFEKKYVKGVTLTAEGFYAPQGRKIRIPISNPSILDDLTVFKHPHHRVTNLEMETAGIYGLGKIMGHECLSINALIANRATLTFSEDPKLTVDKMIEEVLEVLTDKMSMI